MSGRGRGRRPIDVPPATMLALRKLIAGRAGHPCPDNDVLAHALGVDVRTVRYALDRLEAAGQLQIQRSAFVGGLRRRMRVKIGERWRKWTTLTKRGAYDLRITAPDLQVNGVHHLAHVLAAGKYE